MTLTPEIESRIRSIIESNSVVLFMKGDRGAPQCGFSAQVVQILDRVLPEYKTCNVLADPEVRDGIKAFSDWPTIPQLYIGGEFQGGCDIVREMYQAGELHRALGFERPLPSTVRIDVTEPAQQVLLEASRRHGGGDLHLGVDARYRPSFGFGPASGDEVLVEAGEGLRILLDVDSASRADGMVVDAVETPQGRSLRIENPNAPEGVRAP
ncbi:MAG TPA: Grx4 family monothiol glutaredoxin [Thermoanaerobaculia bacterium]|nr:Grx4 family monothiol glutaredoxin [Thermoanaerobaculia bacterium]